MVVSTVSSFRAAPFQVMINVLKLRRRVVAKSPGGSETRLLEKNEGCRSAGFGTGKENVRASLGPDVNLPPAYYTVARD
jgi:hypothetical protein